MIAAGPGPSSISSPNSCAAGHPTGCRTSTPTTETSPMRPTGVTGAIAAFSDYYGAAVCKFVSWGI
eukprot:7829406-Pyramimonas_sp.AAC.1